jgi:RNA polymerase sigma-70 factor (ECF subfamily)
MDPELLVRAQRGNQGAFEALTVASHPRLFRLAFAILHDPTLAEEATQQAFIDIWRFLRRLRDPARFEAWSYRILVNACRDEARRRSQWVAAGEIPEQAGSWDPDPAGAVADRDQLSRGFSRLSVEHRAVIAMRMLLGLSVEDTAEALGVRPGTVASRLSRALSALRAALEADARPGPAASLEGEGAG